MRTFSGPARGFEPAQAPLWRLVLIRLAENDHRLIWTSHHALFDGRSRRLLPAQILALYERSRGGDEVPLGPPPAFGDHARWLAAQDFATAEVHWKQLLAGIVAPTPLPMAPLPGCAW